MYTGGTGSRSHQHLLYARLGAKYSGPVFSPNPQIALRATTITVEILPRSNLGPGMFLSDPTESPQALLLTITDVETETWRGEGTCSRSFRALVLELGSRLRGLFFLLSLPSPHPCTAPQDATLEVPLHWHHVNAGRVSYCERRKTVIHRDFPGGPAVETLHSQCREPRFDPWSGKRILPTATKTQYGQIN